MTNPETEIPFAVMLLLCSGFVLLVVFLVGKAIDSLYILAYKRPLYVHLYFKKRKLSPVQKEVLETKFSFYKKLSKKHKTYFEHRLVCFIEDKEFLGRDSASMDDEKRVLLAATAVMLTFGMRDYLITIVEKIIVYPEAFYSVLNKQFHKGEFNPMLKALVFSWKDFVQGYAIEDDNLNLGIHEFAHAIHLKSLRSNDTASVVFASGYEELQSLLQTDRVKYKMMDSDYFRAYAFTNQFEFIAVVLENFIESPDAFKRLFPEVYYQLRQMLNFRFAGY